MGKFTLDTKAKRVVCVINPPLGADTFPPDFYVDLNQWLIENADVYAYILHDLDILPETGDAKRHHVHVYFEGKTCRRLLANLNDLAKCLHYDNEQIGIEKATSIEGCVQYMVHKNNPEKHQYDKRDIISNLTSEQIDAILSRENANVSLTAFASAIMLSANKYQLIERIGLEVYKEYRLVLLDLWNDLKRR